MQEIKTTLKKYILDLMEGGQTPTTILPELIKQYEELDKKYPDSKKIESASFEQTFEERLQGPIKVITALLKNEETKDGNFREVTIRNDEAFLFECNTWQPLVSGHTKVIYEDEK